MNPRPPILKECLDRLALDLEETIPENWMWLNLDDYCKDGGSIDPEILVQDVQFDAAENDLLKGTFHIEFSESYSAGCRDIHWSNDFSGSVKFQLNVITGEFTMLNESIRHVPSTGDEPEPEG